MGIKMDYHESVSVVKEVLEDHPLHGKLVVGDTLLSINGNSAKTYQEIVQLMSGFKGGDKFTMEVKNGMTRTVKGKFRPKPLVLQNMVKSFTIK